MTVDMRRELSVAQVTWDRLNAAGQAKIVLEAAQLGYRLVVAGPEATWAPEPDLNAWGDRLSR